MIAAAATDRGYDYIAITDHSKRLKIAGGIDEQALAAQSEEIDAVNHSLECRMAKLRVLKSVELNLDPQVRRRYR